MILTRVVLVISLLVLCPFRIVMAQKSQTDKDEEISIVEWEDLKYPPLAKQGRIQGIVVVQASLDDNGKVAQSTAIWGNKYLVSDCLVNAKKWRFRGKPRSIVIVYDFRINDGVCHPGLSSSHFALWPPNFASITTCEVPVGG